MRKLEWGLIGVLALGGIGHLVGTFMGYPPGSEVFVWSMTAVFYVFAVVFLQVLRLRRPNDRFIRIGASAATTAWMVAAMAFGGAIGSLLDPRALLHAGASAALLITTFIGGSHA